MRGSSSAGLSPALPRYCNGDLRHQALLRELDERLGLGGLIEQHLTDCSAGLRPASFDSGEEHPVAPCGPAAAVAAGNQQEWRSLVPPVSLTSK